MIIIGLDIGIINTGVAILDTEKRDLLYCDTIVSSNKEFPTFRSQLRNLEEKLLNLYDRYNPSLFVYETPFFTGRSIYIGNQVFQALGVARLISFNKGCDEFSFSPKGIKKIITSKATADKKEVEEGVKHLFSSMVKDTPVKFKSDHASDALACILCYLVQNP